MRLSGRGFDDLTVSNPDAVGHRLSARICWRRSGAAQSLVYDPQPFGLAGGARGGRGRLSPPRRARSAVARRRSPPAAARATPSSSSCSAIPAIRCWCRRRAIRCSSTSPGSSRCMPSRTSRSTTARGASISTISARRSGSGRGRSSWSAPTIPTGGWLKRDELTALLGFCAEHQLALIGDEVFCDYPIDPAPGAAQLGPGARGDGVDDRARRRVQVAWACRR